MTSFMQVGSILLDDASAIAEARSRLYQNPILHLKAFTAEEVDHAFSVLEASSKNGLYAVALFHYELGTQLLKLPDSNKALLLEIYLYHSYQALTAQQANDWLNQFTNDEPAGISNIQHTHNKDSFSNKIDDIHHQIRAGNTYQVNFTYPITGRIYGNPINIYQTLKQKQPANFGALICKENGYIFSYSPEWFISHRGGSLCAKPMKGTISASPENFEALHNDPKNRAENLMIVDLLRNDLSKIAKPSTVNVPELFKVTQHGSVLQMTSTITARLKDNTPLKDIIKATFPCGSVTGAPKKKTMEIISQLEDRQRGLYCGAIAWLDPKTDQLGDFGMSVVIRTLEIDSQQHFHMGVGAGITIDSQADEEWQECQIKASFLKYQHQFGLFETMAFEHGQVVRLNEHLARLHDSATYFDMPFDMNQIITTIDTYCIGLEPQNKYRLRLELSAQGQILLTSHTVAPLKDHQKIILAHHVIEPYQPTQSGNPLLNHKITYRGQYDQAWQLAEKMGYFDAIFTNERGQITEGGRSNLFVLLEGQWVTPPLSDGCLPGIMRAQLLKDPQYNAHEKSISVQELHRASQIIVCNSLRGVVPVIMES